jgi:hypothetical protein
MNIAVPTTSPSAMLCRRTSIVRPAGDHEMRVTCDPDTDALFSHGGDGEVSPNGKFDITATGHAAGIDILGRDLAARGRAAVSSGLDPASRPFPPDRARGGGRWRASRQRAVR